MIWPQSRCRGILPAAPEDGGARLIVTGLLTTQTIDGYLSTGVCPWRALLGVGGRLNDNRLLAVLVTNYVTESPANECSTYSVEHLIVIAPASSVAPMASAVASFASVASSGP